MRITSARFVKGITGTNDILYDGRFQIAFIGRSNVGKSTLINSLAGRKHMARTSSSPGQTIRMDFFLINEMFYFVDFPGYGYAKTSADKREKLRKMILWYLMYSKVKNRLIILITDANVGITDFDRDSLDIIREQKLPHIIIANKADKLKMSEREPKLNAIREVSKDSLTIAYSAKENSGRAILLDNLNRFLG